MSLEFFDAISNVGLLERLRLVVGNMEDILLIRGTRQGCMVDIDRYSEMYRHARSEYDLVINEIAKRLEKND